MRIKLHLVAVFAAAVGLIASPLTLKVGDNVPNVWDGYLATTATDWSKAGVLDLRVVPGETMPESCKPTGGVVLGGSVDGDPDDLGVALRYDAIGRPLLFVEA